MKDFLAVLPIIICLVLAGILAMNSVHYWGWFLFAAFLFWVNTERL